MADVPALESLILTSVHELQRSHYSEAQRAAALGPVFGVDRQLIRDGTCYVVENYSSVVACGGWSRRRSMFGSNDDDNVSQPELDRHIEAARIRAFFAHPNWARRGLGRRLLHHCEQAIVEGGFQRGELVATLAGEPFYMSCGYSVDERFNIPLPNGLELPVVRMTRTLSCQPPR